MVSFIPSARLDNFHSQRTFQARRRNKRNHTFGLFLRNVNISEESQEERPTVIIISKFPKEATLENLRARFLMYGSIKDCYFLGESNENKQACIIFYNGHSGVKNIDADLVTLDLQGFKVKPKNNKNNNESQKYLKKSLLSNTSHINKLSDECLLKIFEYLPVMERFNLRRVSTRWCTIANTSLQMVESLDFITPKLHLKTRTQRIEYEEQIQESLNELKELQLPLEESSIYCTKVMRQSSLDLVFLLNMHLLAMKCRHLSELIIRSSTDNEHILRRILMANEELRYIEIIQNKYIRGESLICLSKKIHTFVMDSCCNVQSNLLCAALKRLGNLNYLKLIRSCGYEVLNIFNEYCQDLEFLQFESLKSGHQWLLNELLPTTNLTNLRFVKIAKCDVPIGFFLSELSKNCPKAITEIEFAG